MHHLNEFNKISYAQATEPRSVKSLEKDKSMYPTLFKQSWKYSANLKKDCRWSNAVVVRDALPIYAVKKHGFHAMVETLNLRYQLSHKDFISRTAIPELYKRI